LGWASTTLPFSCWLGSAASFCKAEPVIFVSSTAVPASKLAADASLPAATSNTALGEGSPAFWPPSPMMAVDSYVKKKRYGCMLQALSNFKECGFLIFLIFFKKFNACQPSSLLPFIKYVFFAMSNQSLTT
jgi:hypothetical protein